MTTLVLPRNPETQTDQTLSPFPSDFASCGSARKEFIRNKKAENQNRHGDPCSGCGQESCICWMDLVD